MLDRSFRLSFNWSYFSEEYDRLKIVFSRLSYPDGLVNSTISPFTELKASDHPDPELPAASNELDPVRLVLRIKDQASADIVRTQLKDLSQKIQVTLQPTFVSHKINNIWKSAKSSRLLLTNNPFFKCDLCHAGYVGYTRRHFHQRIEEHNWMRLTPLQNIFVSNILKCPKDLTENFTIFKKYKKKFECFIYDMFF